MTDDTPGLLEDGVRHWLPEIDDHFEERLVPIHNRVLQAAVLFVTECVEDIRGDTKDDFFVKPWFAAIYKTTLDWYEKKYGAALRTPEDPLCGAVQIAGAIFRLAIPRTLSRVEKPGETAWLIFPADVQDGEDPLQWIVHPPNLEIMSEHRRSEIRAVVAKLGTWLRTAHVDLMTTTRPDLESQHLVDTVLPHLRSSANYLIDPHRKCLGLAVWDAHQAVESVLKLLCRQEGGSHAKTHELSVLFHTLGSAIQSGIEVELIRRIPNQGRVIAMRAGEGPGPGLSDAYEVYLAAVQLVQQCAAASDRKVRMRNAGFLLKKPLFNT